MAPSPSALAFGTGYALWNAQGIPEVDAVERVHFVEYGLITLLFYRVWRPRGDASMFVLPMLAGIAVGTLEEWLQWFIPGRVGDMRDVFLNIAAIVCGLLFSVGVDPPDGRMLTLRPGSLRRIGIVAAAVALLFALFVRSVHLGVETADPEAGRFRSRYDAATLVSIGQDRLRPLEGSAADRAAAQPEPRRPVHERRPAARPGAESPLGGRRHSRGVVREPHPREYYAPVLDTPSYISRTGHRWPAGQRADAEQRFGARLSGAPSYESRADATEGRHFIRIWSPFAFWTVVIFVVCGVLVLCFVLDRRRARRLTRAGRHCLRLHLRWRGLGHV